jgi:hypothetical protein
MNTAWPAALERRVGGEFGNFRQLQAQYAAGAL